MNSIVSSSTKSDNNKLSANNKLNYVNFSQRELSDLFTSSKEGNSSSFERLSLYIREISFSYFLSKYHSGKLHDRLDVDDLTNNVYLAFAGQYQDIDNLEFWLRRVLFITFINFYKHSKTNRTYEFDETYYRNNDQLEQNIAERQVDTEKILKILETLSADKQRILKMRFWRDLKFADIAKELNKSEVAVKKMFYRTIEELKKKI